MSIIEIDVETQMHTNKALLVYNGKTQCWIQRSLISDYTGDEDCPDSIFITEFLAEQKGLI